MQTIFLLLTALAVALIARKKGRSVLGWGAAAAAGFLVVDTIVALILLSALGDPSDELLILTLIPQKLVVSGWLIAMFRANIRQRRIDQPSGELAAVPPAAPAKGEQVVDAAALQHSRFFVRRAGSSGYTGPFSVQDISHDLSIGKLAESDLVVVAAGQPHRELKQSADDEWMPISSLFLRH